MIEVERITLREIHLPLVEPFRSARGSVAMRRILLVELSARNGARAWSECVAEATPSYAPDTVDTCWLAIAEWLAPRLMAVGMTQATEAAALLEVGIRGHRMARAALEMGVWVLEAEQRHVPLAHLLAERSTVRSSGPRPHVETGIAIGMQEHPQALVERAREALALGYCRIKMKVAPGRDVAYVRAVREALGADAPLSVDANCGYTLGNPAHDEALRALDAYGLTMIEQPLAHDDLLRHATLQQHLATPICMDESIVSAATAEDMLALGSGRMVNLKPARVGGFAESLAIHDICARAHVPVWCGGMLESGIGRACNVALASLPGFTAPGDLSPSARYWERDIVSPEWTMDERGRVRVPLDQPGLGVTVDTDYVDALTVRSLTLGEH